MNATKNQIAEIHNRAVAIAESYRRCEIEIIEILEEVDRYRVYLYRGYNSLFAYATGALRLSEEVAYIFINVCRKTRAAPALKEEIKTGALTVSKARKITSVLTLQNQDHWLTLAKNSSARALERAVAIAQPKSAVRDLMGYVNEADEIKEKVKLLKFEETSRVQLQIGISEALMLQIRRAQDLLSQKRQSNASLEETISMAIRLYIEKNDPLRKAERQKMSGRLLPNTIPQSSPSASNHREPIPASIRHKLWLQHDGRCAHTTIEGQRCMQRRHLQIHHRHHVAKGGTNELSNLILLCSGHHQVAHVQQVT